MFRYLQDCVAHGWQKVALPICWICLLCYIIYILATTADKYFCVALTDMVEKMGIPPSIAGVTFLSFGNGGPDVFALMSAVVSGYSHIGMGSNLGAGLFITTVITGVVAFMSECRVNPLSFFRDLITYIVRVLRRGSRAGVDDLFGSCVFRREGPRVGSRGLLRHLLRLRRRGHHLPKAVRGGLRGRCRSGGRT